MSAAPVPCAGSEHSIPHWSNLMKSLLTPPRSATLFIIGCLLLTGCQSSGSKWAWWNPISKTPEDVSIAARTAPALPSDTATPLVEGTEPSSATQVASDTAQPVGGEAPAFQVASADAPSSTPEEEAAKIAASPTIAKAPSFPAAKTSPEIQSTPSTPPPATQIAASGGPYDPNGYQPEVKTTVAPAKQPANRYAALDNRYGESTPGANPVKTPPIAVQPAPSSRYRYGEDRYAQSAPPASSPGFVPTQPKVASTPPPTAPAVQPGYQASETTPITPVTPQVNVAAQPTTNSIAETLPAAPPEPESATIGTLPKQSVNGAQPINSVAASSEKNPTGETAVQPIRIATAPGQYRPAGTGTYRPSISIATRPEQEAPATTEESPPAGTQLR